MLRTILIACALGLPGVAAAQDFPASPVGIEVKADDGTVVGHVESVRRDRHHRLLSVAIPGNEPADAPAASPALVAQQQSPFSTLVSYGQARQERDARNDGGAGPQTRLR